MEPRIYHFKDILQKKIYSKKLDRKVSVRSIMGDLAAVHLSDEFMENIKPTLSDRMYMFLQGHGDGKFVPKKTLVKEALTKNYTEEDIDAAFTALDEKVDIGKTYEKEHGTRYCWYKTTQEYRVRMSRAIDWFNSLE